MVIVHPVPLPLQDVVIVHVVVGGLGCGNCTSCPPRGTRTVVITTVLVPLPLRMW